jgi:hypothetical protein
MGGPVRAYVMELQRHPPVTRVGGSVAIVRRKKEGMELEALR